MKKDIFNGKIVRGYEKFALFSIIFGGAVCVACGALFTVLLVFYDNLTADARPIIICFAVIMYAIGVAYPPFAIKMVRIYPKFKGLTKWFILKPELFTDYQP